MSSCDQQLSIFFQVGGLCTGFGTCVNSTVNPGRLLCLCNDGHSGASDFFDTRVEQRPDGRYLSLSCGESQGGTVLVWSFVLVLVLIRLYQLAPVFFRYWGKHHTFAREKTVKRRCMSFMSNFALKVLTYDLFITTLLLFMLVMSKLSGLTIGTDVLPTFCLNVVVLSFNMINLQLNKREFSVFARRTMGAENSKSIEGSRMILKIMRSILFMIIIMIPSWWVLSVDKNLGPLLNFEFVAIILRNVGTTLCSGLDLVTAIMVRQQVQRMMKMSNDLVPKHDLTNFLAAGRTSTAARMDLKMEEITTRLDNDVRSNTIFFIITGLFFAIFLNPMLFPFQTYALVFIVGLGTLRHSGRSFENDYVAKPNTYSKHASVVQWNDMTRQLVSAGGREKIALG